MTNNQTAITEAMLKVGRAAWQSAMKDRNLDEWLKRIYLDMRALDPNTRPLPDQEAVACTMGVGCEEAGVCYAVAHGKPGRCPHLTTEQPHDQ